MTISAPPQPPADLSGRNATYVWSISLVVAMGGLLFGYDWIVISGADLFYEKYFALTSSFQIGWAKSCALIGCLIGALISGALSDRLGRKRLLLASGFLFTASAVGTAMANSYDAFVIWRIAGGVGIGLASNLSPIYIAEAAPAVIRGKLVSMNQLTIVIGILVAQLANWLIAEPVPRDASVQDILHSWNGQFGWRWMFAAETVPAVLFLIGLCFVPESPRWLVATGQKKRARRILSRIGGAKYAKGALADIETTLVRESTRGGFHELLEPRMKRILILGAALAFLQQWCGINVIFYYAKDVFAAAGYAVSDILLSIVIIGLANLVFTILAIATVDRLGRRFLMLAGWFGLAVIYVLLGFSHVIGLTGIPVVVLVVAAIGCYACTLAPVVWVVLSEIFPNRIRGAAMSIAVFALWTGCFTLTYSFPVLHGWLGAAGIYWTYAAICAFGYWFVWRKLPETKGKTLETIERELLD